jgi:hypothetical protein
MKIIVVFLTLFFTSILAFGDELTVQSTPARTPVMTSTPAVQPVPTVHPTPIQTPSPTPMAVQTPFQSPAIAPLPTPIPSPYWEVTKFPVTTKEHRLRFAVSGYYGLGSSLQADNISVTTNGTQIWASGNFPTNLAPGVAISLYDMPQNSFGWLGEASYDFSRVITGLNASDTNGNQVGGPFNSPQTTITFLTISGNLAYRFESTYLEFGANYTFPNLAGGINNFGSTSITGGVGVQMGAGVNLSDTFALEFWLQELSLCGNTNTSASSLNYYNLYFFNPQLRLRASF